MKAIIVDDEIDAIQTLEFLLQNYCPDVEIVGKATGILEAKEIIIDEEPDLVFLDVVMPRGTGFELLGFFPQRDFDVIFVTAHNEFAINAFRFSAVDYLLKPVDQDELIVAVKKVKERRGLRQEINMEVLMENVQSKKPKKIAVSNLEGINYINVDEIICVQAEGSYSIIHLTDKRKIILSKNLKEYESLFHSYDFYRIHNSYIVNLEFVERFSMKEGAIIEMKNGMEIPISRKKKDQFLILMNNFVAKQNSKPDELS